MESVLAQLASGQVDERHRFSSREAQYKLSQSPIRDVVSLESESNGVKTAFKKNVDFRINDNSVEWMEGGKKPEEDGIFTIRYFFGEQAARRRLTDTNVGSVTRNLVEAMARELDLLYEQLDTVYSSGFIDSAAGASLDYVVAVLGVTRKPPQNATGYVTFGREADPPEIPVDSEIGLFDGSPEFRLKVTPIKSVKKLEGTVRGEKYSFELGKEFKLAEDRIVWLDQNNKPDLNTQIRVQYTAHEKIVVAKGTEVSTFSDDVRRIRTYVTEQEGILQNVSEEPGGGMWEVDVPVRAEEGGTFGNAPSGSVTIMPQPPIGIEFVINRRGLTGGTEVEGDAELRERAKRALQSIGKATLPSLDGALRSVEGVKSVVIEDMPDGARGIVKVVVHGGDLSKIEKVIRETRAAGIKVELIRPQVLYSDINIRVNLDEGVSAGRTREKIEDTIRKYLSSLEVGQDVVYNRIIAQVIAVPGVQDVVSMKISVFDMERQKAESSTGTNFHIDNNELVEPRAISVILEGGDVVPEAGKE